MLLGQFEKGLEFYDNAIRLSPHDPALADYYIGKAINYLGLKQYDQTIDYDRRSIAINPNTSPWPHIQLIAALALTGHESEAREALQKYLAAVPSGPKTIAAWKAAVAPVARADSPPRYLESLDREYEGLQKAGVPEA